MLRRARSRSAGVAGGFQTEAPVGERLLVREAARTAARFHGNGDQQPAILDHRLVPHVADRVAVVETDVPGGAQVG